MEGVKINTCQELLTVIIPLLNLRMKGELEEI
jgi:hypothetical protein